MPSNVPSAWLRLRKFWTETSPSARRETRTACPTVPPYRSFRAARIPESSAPCSPRASRNDASPVDSLQRPPKSKELADGDPVAPAEQRERPSDDAREQAE